jgi:hypothetical protein
MLDVAIGPIGAGGISGVDVPERDCVRGRSVGVAGAELRFEVFCGPSRGRSPR